MIPPHDRMSAKDRTLVVCISAGVLVIVAFGSLRVVLGPSVRIEAPVAGFPAVLAEGEEDATVADVGLSAAAFIAAGSRAPGGLAGPPGTRSFP